MEDWRDEGEGEEEERRSNIDGVGRSVEGEDGAAEDDANGDAAVGVREGRMGGRQTSGRASKVTTSVLGKGRSIGRSVDLGVVTDKQV